MTDMIKWTAQVDDTLAKLTHRCSELTGRTEALTLLITAALASIPPDAKKFVLSTADGIENSMRNSDADTATLEGVLAVLNDARRQLDY